MRFSWRWKTKISDRRSGICDDSLFEPECLLDKINYRASNKLSQSVAISRDSVLGQ